MARYTDYIKDFRDDRYMKVYATSLSTFIKEPTLVDPSYPWHTGELLSKVHLPKKACNTNFTPCAPSTTPLTCFDLISGLVPLDCFKRLSCFQQPVVLLRSLILCACSTTLRSLFLWLEIIATAFETARRTAAPTSRPHLAGKDSVFRWRFIVPRLPLGSSPL